MLHFHLYYSIPSGWNSNKKMLMFRNSLCFKRAAYFDRTRAITTSSKTRRRASIYKRRKSTQITCKNINLTKMLCARIREVGQVELVGSFPRWRNWRNSITRFIVIQNSPVSRDGIEWQCSISIAAIVIEYSSIWDSSFTILMWLSVVVALRSMSDDIP